MSKDQVKVNEADVVETEETETSTESSKMSTTAKVAVWGLGALALTGLVAGGLALACRFGGSTEAAAEAADAVTSAFRK